MRNYRGECDFFIMKIHTLDESAGIGINLRTGTFLITFVIGFVLLLRKKNKGN